jgi:hypothetical protein
MSHLRGGMTRTLIKDWDLQGYGLLSKSRCLTSARMLRSFGTLRWLSSRCEHQILLLIAVDWWLCCATYPSLVSLSMDTWRWEDAPWICFETKVTLECFWNLGYPIGWLVVRGWTGCANGCCHDWRDWKLLESLIANLNKIRLTNVVQRVSLVSTKVRLKSVVVKVCKWRAVVRFIDPGNSGLCADDSGYLPKVWRPG